MTIPFPTVMELVLSDARNITWTSCGGGLFLGRKSLVRQASPVFRAELFISRNEPGCHFTTFRRETWAQDLANGEAQKGSIPYPLSR